MADDIPSRVAVLEQIAREVRDALVRIDGRLDRMDGQSDSRLGRIEDKIDKLNSRLWTNFYWMLGAFATLLGVMAHGFKWL